MTRSAAAADVDRRVLTSRWFGFGLIAPALLGREALMDRPIVPFVVDEGLRETIDRTPASG
jgi:hypothetical protein